MTVLFVGETPAAAPLLLKIEYNIFKNLRLACDVSVRLFTRRMNTSYVPELNTY